MKDSVNDHSAYHTLIEQVSELSARLTERYHTHLNCRAGCSACCHHHLSVFPVEAAQIKEAIASLPAETQQTLKRQAAAVREREARNEPVACPLLVNDRCAIYAARPVICRTQGLPLLYEAADGHQEVDFCPLNFTAEHATEELDEAHLVPLDTLNLKLAAVNLNYCRSPGINDDEAFQRISMADIIEQATRS
ncbi:MAG TPA: YkgJ family cysteine cluster protein [Blastocatellia bacterium]|nr:YkgJ family cysteine cluster protein [Blastocatellia bacterium]